MRGSGDFTSIGDLLRGKKPGQYHFESPSGWTFTTGPTEDPRYPGGRYASLISQGSKRTIVWDTDGNIVYDSGYKHYKQK